MASLTGFFSQQLVQFQDCLEHHPTAVASLSRTNSYARTGGSAENNYPVDFAPMVAAINVGVIQPISDFTNTLSSGCITGNCTFPATHGASFSTIGVSHRCEDITTHIRTVNESSSNSTVNTWGYLALDYGNNETREWPRERGGTVLQTWTSTPLYLKSSDLLTIYFVYRRHWRQNYDYKAISCSLFPTVDTFKADINNTILEEDLVDRTLLRTSYSQFAETLVPDYNRSQELAWWTYKMTTNYTLRNGIRESCDGADRPTPELVEFMKSSEEPTYVNLTGHESVSAGWRWWYYPKDCIWSIHKFSVMAISDTLGEIFDDGKAIMGTKGGVQASPHLRQIFLDGNMTLETVNERIQGLTKSMTAVIRANGGDGELDEAVKGEVWLNTTCMYVRWSWISFPAIMIGLTGVFLILIVVQNRGVERDRLWKSSFLAALFCEIEMLDKPIGKKEMFATAKSTSVSVANKDGGILRLVAS